MFNNLSKVASHVSHVMTFSHGYHPLKMVMHAKIVHIPYESFSLTQTHLLSPTNFYFLLLSIHNYSATYSMNSLKNDIHADIADDDDGDGGEKLSKLPSMKYLNQVKCHEKSQSAKRPTMILSRLESWLKWSTWPKADIRTAMLDAQFKIKEKYIMCDSVQA